LFGLKREKGKNEGEKGNNEMPIQTADLFLPAIIAD
jgi:hypothetical protein